jgi:ribosomal protein L7/L12
VGAAWIIYTAVADRSWSGFVIGPAWLMMAASFFLVARQLRRRERLGFDQEAPEAGQDVLTLLRQGRKIEAIKRYRQLHPGIGLRDAKRAVDEL